MNVDLIVLRGGKKLSTFEIINYASMARVL